MIIGIKVKFDRNIKMTSHVEVQDFSSETYERTKKASNLWDMLSVMKYRVVKLEKSFGVASQVHKSKAWCHRYWDLDGVSNRI